MENSKSDQKNMRPEALSRRQFLAKTAKGTIALGLSHTFLSSCAGRGSLSGSPPEKTKQTDVLLLKHEKLENRASDRIGEILRDGLGLRTKSAHIGALRGVNFQDAKLIVFPGGAYLSKSLSDAVARIAPKVQAAVASGTGYIGICCGAFAAAEGSAVTFHLPLKGGSFGIFPGLAEGTGGRAVCPFYFDVNHPVFANSSVRDNVSAVMRLKFQGGATNLVPSYNNALQNWALATLDKPLNGEPLGRRAVMTTTLFGKGRVFLTGPHPEAREDTHAILLAAAEWCIHLSDPVSNRHPVLKADVPQEGVVNQFYVCSASGSYDPHGYPVGFIWDFGDGSPKQFRPEAIHRYKNPGRYKVTLAVTTGTRQSTKAIEVEIKKI